MLYRWCAACRSGIIAVPTDKAPGAAADSQSESEGQQAAVREVTYSFHKVYHIPSISIKLDLELHDKYESIRYSVLKFVMYF